MEQESVTVEFDATAGRTKRTKTNGLPFVKFKAGLLCIYFHVEKELNTLSKNLGYDVIEDAREFGLDQMEKIKD